MATGQWAVVLRHVRRLFDGETIAGLTEGELLDRFVADRDEAAFEALLARHGPMVLGVCRGVLDDPNDVDDAFQATFLVLVRKAAALRNGDRLAQWLYGVARKVALRARSQSTLRKSRERTEAEAAVDTRSTLDAELRELQSLIREEVDRLSGHDRMAVVLCYLDGLTHEEAADRLGWPVGTVKGRLSRAREKLRGRLTRRGVALPALAISSTFVPSALAAVPLPLIRSTTLAAIRLASGQTLTAGIVSAHALTLMEGALGTMFATQLKLGAAALIATCVVGVPGVLAYQAPGGVDKVGKAAAQVPNPPVEVKTIESKALKSVQTSPDEATPIQSMLVTMTPQARDRATMVALSEEALKLLGQMLAQGQIRNGLAETSVWARRLVEAKAGPDVPEAERKAAFRAYRDRMRQQAQSASQLKERGAVTAIDVLEAQYRLAEAERWLRNGRIDAIAVTSPPQAGFDGGFDPGAERKPLVIKTMPGDEKRNQAIVAKLEENLTMNFAAPTPMADVLKYIKDATQDEAAGIPTGIPVYVDPVGLEDTGTTMADTVAIQLDGIPLRTTLRLILHQRALVYRVEGGLLIITGENEPPVAPGPAAGGNPGGLGGGFR